MSEDDAVIAVSAMQRSRVVPVNQELSLLAADLSLQHGLAMADALILATAQAFGAEFVTSDRDFEQVPGVVYLPKR
jgi:predicted nucleic acid-binding protein